MTALDKAILRFASGTKTASNPIFGIRRVFTIVAIYNVTMPDVENGMYKFNFRVPESLLRDLDAEATISGRTRSELMRTAFVEYFERIDRARHRNEKERDNP